jgi:hypothetical protein
LTQVENELKTMKKEATTAKKEEARKEVEAKRLKETNNNMMAR